MEPRAQVKELGKQLLPTQRGFLAEDYDGIGDKIAVKLSSGSTSSAIATIAAGAFATGQEIPAGTAVTIVSNQGHLEIISLGTGTRPDSIEMPSVNLSDYAGNLMQDQSGYGPEWVYFIHSGLANSSFTSLPINSEADIDDDNEMPFWSAEINGTTVTVRNVAEDNGKRVLRFTALGGATPWEWAGISQLVPIISTGDALISYTARAIVKTSDVVPSHLAIGIWGYYYDSNFNWVGDVAGGSYPLSGIGAETTEEISLVFGTPPSEAVYLSVWLTLAQYTAGAGGTTVDMYYPRIEINKNQVMIPESDNRDSYSAASIWQGDGALWIAANQGGAAGHGSYILIDGSIEATGDTIYLSYDGTDEVSFGDNGDFARQGTNCVNVKGDLFPPNGIICARYKSSAVASDSDFSGSAHNGGIEVNAYSGNRFYFRTPAGWYYVTGSSFSIPRDETVCPVCREMMKPDDALIGKGDRYEKDGALHGYWIHLRCADLPLDPEMKAAYETISRTSRERDSSGRNKIAKTLLWLRGIRRTVGGGK